MHVSANECKLMLVAFCMANDRCVYDFFFVFHRYTVVFKEHEYLENEKQHFERCPVSSINTRICMNSAT